jgi:GNAT superfamily N-acetyltransferase
VERWSGEYVVTDDRARIDRDVVHRWLVDESYWAMGRTREVFERSLEHSMAFSLRHVGPDGERQAGFARVVTDRATFAWLCDVFVLPDHRGHGLGKLLVAATLEHPELVDVPRWVLGTKDAHGLYAGFGYAPLAHPGRMMAIDRRPPEPAGRS